MSTHKTPVSILQYTAINQVNRHGLIAVDVGLDVFLNEDQSAQVPWKTIKDEGQRRVEIYPLTSGRYLIAKTYICSGLYETVRAFLLKNRAQNSHHKSLMFAVSGCNTPLTFGYTVRRRGLLSTECCHYSEYLQNSSTLFTLFSKEKAGHKRQKLILIQLAQQLAMLHRQGLVHGDTKLSNILVDEETVVFIDLDGFGRATKRRSSLQDIARLVVALSEVSAPLELIRQFVAAYCSCSNLDKDYFISSLQSAIASIQSRHFKKYGRTVNDIDLSDEQKTDSL